MVSGKTWPAGFDPNLTCRIQLAVDFQDSTKTWLSDFNQNLTFMIQPKLPLRVSIKTWFSEFNQNLILRIKRKLDFRGSTKICLCQIVPPWTNTSMRCRPLTSQSSPGSLFCRPWPSWAAALKTNLNENCGAGRIAQASMKHVSQETHFWHSIVLPFFCSSSVLVGEHVMTEWLVSIPAGAQQDKQSLAPRHSHWLDGQWLDGYMENTNNAHPCNFSL